MKKLVLFAVAALSMSFFACGKGDANAEAADSAADTAVVAEEVAAPADSAAEVAAPADSAAEVAAPADSAKAE